MHRSIVFVSGGSGFVGTALIRELLGRGFRVHTLVHRKPLQMEDARVTVFHGELDDPASLYPAIERAVAAIHLVGIIRQRRSQRVTFQRMHVGFTQAMVEACVKHGVKRMIHMSALGARVDAPSEYHRTKAQGEEIVKGSPLDWTILRPSLIHGEGGEFTQMVRQWSRGRKAPWLFIPYFGAGVLGFGRKRLVQPVRVEDVARVCVDALDRPATVRKIYEVGGEERMTWPQMYKAIAPSSRPAIAIPAWYASMLTRILPARLLPFNRDQVLMSQEDSVADMTPFIEDFGFTPRS